MKKGLMIICLLSCVGLLLGCEKEYKTSTCTKVDGDKTVTKVVNEIEDGVSIITSTKETICLENGTECEDFIDSEMKESTTDYSKTIESLKKEGYVCEE